MKGDSKFFPEWQLATITTSATIREVMQIITKSGALIACIVDAHGKLLAIMTDSDVRRAILQGADVNDRVDQWCQRNPVVYRDDASVAELVAIAEQQNVREIPLVDADGKLQDIFMLMRRQHRVTRHQQKSVEGMSVPLPNQMLILAGGMGTRLRPVVSDRPKPLAVVGDKPIIETLIVRAAACGIRHFFVAVNYMAEQIMEYLQGPQFANVRIDIIRESERLGTAGAIGLVNDRISEPLLVGNADVLTTVPFNKIIRHHKAEGAAITCSVRPYEVQVPYGVVEVEGGKITGMREKPRSSHLVNAGLYVLSPDVCRSVEAHMPLDMPDLIARSLGQGHKVVPFLLHEYWVDIGQPEDFHRANREFDENFGDVKI